MERERRKGKERERAGGERPRERNDALAMRKRKRGREKERKRERLDYQYRSEKSYKITTLHFSFRVTPTPGRIQRSTSTVTRDAAYSPRDIHDRVDAEKFKAPRAAEREVQSSTRSKLLIETAAL